MLKYLKALWIARYHIPRPSLF